MMQTLGRPVLTSRIIYSCTADQSDEHRPIRPIDCQSVDMFMPLEINDNKTGHECEALLSKQFALKFWLNVQLPVPYHRTLLNAK